MANTPAWSAPRSGLLGDTGAVNASAQVNQLLGTHASSEIYYGNMILQPDGTGGAISGRLLNAYDIDQPFTMSGTSIGRVAIPLMVSGTGSDMIVSLCSDSGGAPGSVITQTRVPATWINQLSAVTSASVVQSAVNGAFAAQIAPNYTGSPLATAQFNKFYMASVVTTNWPYPTSKNLGPGTGPTSCYYGDYFIQMGGYVSSTFLDNVFTIGFDTTGHILSTVPQPSLPQATDGTAGCVVSVDASGNATVVFAGGATASGTLTNAVYTASFDPTTGNIGAWSTQQNLPGTNQYFGMAAYNGYVYTVGGANGTINNTTVLYAQVQNGQITTWTATTPLPVGQGFNYVAACAGYLFVFGGSILSNINTCYYAAINADGTLGGWRIGPTLPVSPALFNGNPAIVAGTYGIIGNGSGTLFTLGVTANGPDLAWQEQNFSIGGNFFAGVNVQPGVWRYYGLYASFYSTMLVSLYATISVPLPASGLTNGATYHVLIQSPSKDLNNGLALAFDQGTVFPGNPKYSYRVKGSPTWTSSVGGSIPLAVYDNSNNSTSSSGAIGNNHVLHTWEDNGARISTLVHSTTPDSRLLGVLDATSQPGPVLNSNPTFTAGTAPWGGNNGTLAQSSAFTHGNLPFSARFTPNGTSSQGYIESELISIALQQQYTAACWFYSPTGYSNCEILINWYNASGSSGGFISSTTGATTSVAAGTWTALTVTGYPPTTAVYGTVGVYERGTPPASAVFYASAVTLQNTQGPQVSSVAQIDYSGGFNSGNSWPPTGVTVLA